MSSDVRIALEGYGPYLDPPRAFTPTGVMPRLLLLGNGTLVMTSGRPGVDLRFSFDGRGKRWTEPRRWCRPMPPNRRRIRAAILTCWRSTGTRSCWLLVVQPPGADGLPHKSVLTRRVTVMR